MNNQLPENFVVDVFRTSRGFGTRTNDNSEIMIKQGGRVATFLPGWTPKLIYTGFAPLYLLELEHDNGHYSTWFLDTTLNQLATTVNQLNSEWLTILCLHVSRLFAMFFEFFATHPKSKRPPWNHKFFCINISTRMDILNIYISSMKPTSQIIDLSKEPAEAFLLPPTSTGKVALIRRHHVIDLLTQDLHETFLASLERNSLRFNSPVDGRELFANKCICFDEHRFAYRIDDEENERVFYILCGQTDCQTLAILVPGSHQVYCIDQHRVILYKQCFPTNTLPDFWSAMLHHICKYGELFATYLDEPTSAPVIFTPFFHLGHDLHNELAGLQKLVSVTPRENIPDVIVCRGELGSELYGRTEDILPELQRKIIRHIKTPDELIRYCYTHRKFILHITRRYVARDLRSRILRANLNSTQLDADRLLLNDISRRGHIVVLLGLRVENRTLVNLPEFCLHLSEFLHRESGGCAIVLDGHVSLNPEVGSKIFAGDSEHRASKSPVEVEREIAQLLVERLGDRIQIVNNIGAPMRRALFWCVNARFFVAIGGTGLAKYRWVCNKPGLIITNKKGVNYGDMRIYQPPIMEEDTPLDFVRLEDVEDDPDAPLLVDRIDRGAGGEAFFYNFRVNEIGVFSAVRQLLNRYGSYVQTDEGVNVF